MENQEHWKFVFVSIKLFFFLYKIIMKRMQTFEYIFINVVERRIVSNWYVFVRENKR